MTIRLRPHHLLCMLTYVGKGYSAAFVANLDRIVARLGRGERVRLVDGPDDVCAPLLDEPTAHCRTAGVTDRDRRAALAVGRLLGRELGSGSELRLDPALLARLQAGFAMGETRSACLGCEWHGLCTTVAAMAFRDSRLGAGRPQTG